MISPGRAQYNPNGTLSTVEQAYVVRQFERDALRHLFANRWVLLLGPHKSGKSSALIRIQAQLKDSGYACAFIDLQSYMPADDTYADFLDWFAEKVAAGIGADFTRPPKRRRNQLEFWLRTVVTPEFRNTAILIDEASGVPQPFRVPFFSQLRAVFNSRGRPEGEFTRSIVFIFAGTFRPSGMIDNANSPFNVSFEINPDDLTPEEVAQLAALGLAGEVADCARRAWAETNGQPYYVQHLFAAVQGAGDSPAQRAAAFAAALEDLRQGAHGRIQASHAYRRSGFASPSACAEDTQRASSVPAQLIGP